VQNSNRRFIPDSFGRYPVSNLSGKLRFLKRGSAKTCAKMHALQVLFGISVLTLAFTGCQNTLYLVNGQGKLFKISPSQTGANGPTVTADGQGGSCTLAPALTADLVCAFFAKYLPPACSPTLATHIPERLIRSWLMSPVYQTEEQKFYAADYLNSFDNIGFRAGCSITMSWATPSGNGSHTWPSFGF